MNIKVGDDDGYPVMKVIQWRKSSSDESIIVERSDDLWRFACGDVCKEGFKDIKYHILISQPAKLSLVNQRNSSPNARTFLAQFLDTNINILI